MCVGRVSITRGIAFALIDDAECAAACCQINRTYFLSSGRSNGKQRVLFDLFQSNNQTVHCQPRRVKSPNGTLAIYQIIFSDQLVGNLTAPSLPM